MTVSELIAALEAFQKLHGDLDMRFGEDIPYPVFNTVRRVFILKVAGQPDKKCICLTNLIPDELK